MKSAHYFLRRPALKNLKQNVIKAVYLKPEKTLGIMNQSFSPCKKKSNSFLLQNHFPKSKILTSQNHPAPSLCLLHCLDSQYPYAAIFQQ